MGEGSWLELNLDTDNHKLYNKYECNWELYYYANKCYMDSDLL